MRFDPTGKVTLDHIYTQPDPRAYFQVLRRLDYCVPQLAKPYFAKLVKEYRETRSVAVPKVLDVGCSYGINAALLKYDVTMDELYTRYDDAEPAVRDAIATRAAPGSDATPVAPGADTTCAAAGADAPVDPASEADARVREELLLRDRRLSRSRRPAHPTTVVGLDTSGNALTYALQAGFLDDAVHADLERDELTPEQRDRLSGADLVISTGCIGYVTERTLTRVVRAQGDRRPWMAHFVLRMFPFAPVESALSELGYRTARVEGVFKQRRFASRQEQERVLDTMSAAGVHAGGLEAEGWLYAQLYVSRPYGTA